MLCCSVWHECICGLCPCAAGSLDQGAHLQLQSLAVQAARNKVANAACTTALQAARNKIARLEDMDHQLQGELQRVVGQRDDWSARSSRLEKEVGRTFRISTCFCVHLSCTRAASD